jgi:hypothetical protein
MKRYLSLVLLLALAVGIGLWLGERSRTLTAYDLERASMRLEFSRALLPYRFVFRVALGAVLLLTLGGLGWGTVRWLHRRVDTVYPNDAGLYPVRERRIGRARVFHDPNRAPTATTVYVTGQPEQRIEQCVRVEHGLPEGGAYLQGQVTGQAQAAQAIRAAVSGGGAVPFGPRFPASGESARRVSRPLPEVVRLDLEPSHVERLLIAPEGGDDVA